MEAGNKKCVVKVGDEHYCPKCGVTSTVTSGSYRMTIMNRGVAAVGDITSCGAIIEEGFEGQTIGGRPVAYSGCKTSHGGVLEGDSPVTFEIKSDSPAQAATLPGQ